MFYLYVLKSQLDNNHYIGITKNIGFRIKQHNWGKVKSTKARRPLILLKSEKFLSKKEALKRERYLKSYKGWKERLSLK